MKATTLFFFILHSACCVYAQDTRPEAVQAWYDRQSCSRSMMRRPMTYNSTIRMTAQGAVKNTVSFKEIKRLRIASIILTSVAGLLQIPGAVALTHGASHPDAESSFGEEIIGISLLYAGSAPAAAGLGTWVAYGCRLHRYKRQQAVGQF